MYQNFLQFVLAYLVKRVVGRNDLFIIGVLGSTDAQITMAKNSIYRVLYDEHGELARRSCDGTEDTMGVLLAILGCQKKPSQIWVLPFLIQALFRSREIYKYKYLILGLDIKKAKIDYLAQSFKLDLVVLIDSNNKESQLLSQQVFNFAKRRVRIIIESRNEMTKYVMNGLITVGLDASDADFQASNVTRVGSGASYRITTTGQNIAIKSRRGDDDTIWSQLFAFAVGQTLGIQSLKIKKSFEK